MKNKRQRKVTLEFILQYSPDEMEGIEKWEIDEKEFILQLLRQSTLNEIKIGHIVVREVNHV